jgi:hypothetical protein
MSVYTALRAAEVRAEIHQAVAVVRKSLDATRNPQYPSTVPHTYQDKFLMVELATRAALAVQLNTLANGFGLTPERVQALQAARGNKTVTLRYDGDTTCAFRETRTREEESATRLEKQGVLGKTTYKSVTTITEHFWTYTVGWSVSAYIGTDVDAPSSKLVERRGDQVIMTRSPEPVAPLAEKRKFYPLEVEITWLLDACKVRTRVVRT